MPFACKSLQLLLLIFLGPGHLSRCHKCTYLHSYVFGGKSSEGWNVLLLKGFAHFNTRIEGLKHEQHKCFGLSTNQWGSFSSLVRWKKKHWNCESLKKKGDWNGPQVLLTAFPHLTSVIRDCRCAKLGRVGKLMVNFCRLLAVHLFLHRRVAHCSAQIIPSEAHYRINFFCSSYNSLTPSSSSLLLKAQTFPSPKFNVGCLN